MSSVDTVDTASTTSIYNTISQLNQARNLALSDSTYYAQIVPGVLPLIGPSAHLQLKIWGSEFLAETFASPLLTAPEKSPLALSTLNLLQSFLDNKDENPIIIKNVVQTTTSIFPLVFEHVIKNPSDNSSWQSLVSIKSNIFRRLDDYPGGVRICCVKFVQRVILTQSPGSFADPRKSDINDVSLVIVPSDHPLISSATLEAETSGLLDRLLGLLDESLSDVLLVTSTLNCLGTLARNRPTLANKILATIISYNPFKHTQNLTLTPTDRLNIKSLERTIRALLLYIYKKAPSHPLAPRINHYLERLQLSRIELLEQATRKRTVTAEPGDVSDTKRLRLAAPPPSLPTGPVSLAQLFTLTEDIASTTFDVQAVPFDILMRILVPIICSIDSNRLENAISIVKQRYASICERSANPDIPNDEDEDYEPSLTIDNVEPLPEEDPAPAVMTLGTFNFPEPQPLTTADSAKIGITIVDRLFSLMNDFEQDSEDKGLSRGKSLSGFNRLAACCHDRDALITFLVRLATRANLGLASPCDSDIHTSVTGDDDPTVETALHSKAITQNIRKGLNMYILQDFRRRVDVAIAWLTEEWFNDRVLEEYMSKEKNDLNQDSDSCETENLKNYKTWVLRLLDSVLPFLECRDKVLLRFLSELPALDEDILGRVKKLAEDPERVSLCVQALHYLILMRPPVRQMCLDLIEDLWRNHDDARSLAERLLSKWRPLVISSATPAVSVS